MKRTLPAQNSAEQMKQITDKLENGIKELFESERYKNYLKVMSKFHDYSVNNTVLIAMQKPEATHVAGFSTWKNQFGRSVLKGEKGIRILAPAPYKCSKQMEQIDPDTQRPVLDKNGKPAMREVEVTIRTFKPVTVFDVSQTAGKELPAIGVDELKGTVKEYERFFEAVKSISPVPVEFEKINGGAHGYYHRKEKRIAMDEGMSEQQNLKTLIHEIAHARLHDAEPKTPADTGKKLPDRSTQEVQAESVAYTVCQYYGLDTAEYSFQYIAGWSKGKELTELKASLETIRSAAAGMIHEIDQKLPEADRAAARFGQAAAATAPTATAPTAAPGGMPHMERRRRILEDIGRHGFTPGQRIVSKMEKLNSLTGRQVGVREINEMYRNHAYPEDKEAGALARELAKDFQRQELLKGLILPER